MNGVPLSVVPRLLDHSSPRIAIRLPLPDEPPRAHGIPSAYPPRHVSGDAHQRALTSNPTVCSASAVSLSRRVALTPNDRSGAVAASGVNRQPRL